MDGQEAVVGRAESDNESRFDQELPEEAHAADVEEDDPAADVSATTPDDVAEDPSLTETLDLALTPGEELEEDHEVGVRLPRLQGGRIRRKHVLTKKESAPEDQLVEACEPKPLGRVRSPESELAAVQNDLERLKRENPDCRETDEEHPGYLTPRLSRTGESSRI